MSNWIFDARNGRELFNGIAYELIFKRTCHHGLYDIEGKRGFGAGDGAQDFYQFDGVRYHGVRSVAVEY